MSIQTIKTSNQDNQMLSRADVKGNRKLILVLIQERTLLLVSGRIESSAFSLSLGSCSFSLDFSLVLLLSFFLSLLLVLACLPSFLPSFLLSLSPSGSRLPSFLPSLSCNTFVEQMHSEHNFCSAVTERICMCVSSRSNLHTCKLPLAGLRSPLVKYARGSHIGFLSTSRTRSCALRMPRYVTFTSKTITTRQNGKESKINTQRTTKLSKRIKSSLEKSALYLSYAPPA